MKFYRVEEMSGNESLGFEYFTNKVDAMKHLRACNAPVEVKHGEYGSYDEGPANSGEMEEINIEPTKLGILRGLNHYASHPLNG